MDNEPTISDKLYFSLKLFLGFKSDLLTFLYDLKGWILTVFLAYQLKGTEKNLSPSSKKSRLYNIGTYIPTRRVGYTSMWTYSILKQYIHHFTFYTIILSEVSFNIIHNNCKKKKQFKQNNIIYRYIITVERFFLKCIKGNFFYV